MTTPEPKQHAAVGLWQSHFPYGTEGGLLLGCPPPLIIPRGPLFSPLIFYKKIFFKNFFSLKLQKIYIMLPEWLLEFTRSFELLRTKAYLDSENKWTIGYGTRFYPDGTEVKEGDTVTKELAEKYFKDFYSKNLQSMPKIFPKWDTYPEQLKAALLDISYRGGINNFALKSPIFTRKINEAAEDGTFTKEELNNIIKEIDYSNKTGNLLDRLDRRVAMMYGVYNTDNNGINLATTIKSPYRNIRSNINYPGNIFETLYKVNNRSKANFVSRLKDPNRQTIPSWESNGKEEAAHKLSYVTEDGYDVVFPMVQEEREYPWYDLFHWTDGEPVLKDYTDPKYKDGNPYENAVSKQDTIHVPSGMGEFFTTNYKKYYPGFKKLTGGKLNYFPKFSLKKHQGGTINYAKLF